MSLGDFILRQRRELDLCRSAASPSSSAAIPPRRALLHTHCHRKQAGSAAELRCLSALGLQVEEMDTGCCGMAGAFGFERDHAPVSQAIAGLKLLPAIRSAEASSMLISDGFSCRQQIAQNLPRRMLHTAQALELRLRELRGQPLAGPNPEYTLDPSAFAVPLSTGAESQSRRRFQLRYWLPVAVLALGATAFASQWLLSRRKS